jgi:hypothetical protein
MTSRKLRVLADSLERNFMTEEDRKGWINDLRGLAKGIERSVLIETESIHPDPQSPHAIDQTRG